jgi:hypothetical protein
MKELLLALFVVGVGLVVLYVLGIIPLIMSVFGGLTDLGTDLESMGSVVQVLVHA